jgi:hypothetical protein
VHNPDDEVYWTNAALHTLVRAALLWPIVRYVGGVEGGRAVAASLLASGACTAGQLVYARTTLPKLPLQAPRMVPASAQPTIIPGVVVDVTGEGSAV